MLTSRICPADREWVTGYSKRKTQRRKFAIKQAEEKARKERLQERKERREEMRRNLGLDKQKTHQCSVSLLTRSMPPEQNEYMRMLIPTWNKEAWPPSPPWFTPR